MRYPVCLSWLVPMDCIWHTWVSQGILLSQIGLVVTRVPPEAVRLDGRKEDGGEVTVLGALRNSCGSSPLLQPACGGAG